MEDFVHLWYATLKPLDIGVSMFMYNRCILGGHSAIVFPNFQLNHQFYPSSNEYMVLK